MEILAGVLVVACVLLLYCNYNKSNADGMRRGKNLQGLHFVEGYSDRPRAGTFAARDGYVVGHPKDPALSYTTRSSHFVENMKDQAEDQGLNDRNTRPTPAAVNVEQPTGNENRMMWMPDAEIPLDVYTRDGNVGSHTFTPEDEAFMFKNVFERNNNRVKADGAGSLCGNAMRFIDYGSHLQPTRSITA